jgi:hypothetical protein
MQSPGFDKSRGEKIWRAMGRSKFQNCAVENFEACVAKRQKINPNHPEGFDLG